MPVDLDEEILHAGLFADALGVPAGSAARAGGASRTGELSRR